MDLQQWLIYKLFYLLLHVGLDSWKLETQYCPRPRFWRVHLSERQFLALLWAVLNLLSNARDFVSLSAPPRSIAFP